MVVIQRVDDERMAGDINLQDLVPVMKKDVKETQTCLAAGNSMVRVESKSFSSTS